ncbi:HD domain-containing protein [Rhodococcus sp. NPDC059234]|uniref:HD domain-containing protein n=1 Tax=Rhodococcus sp. NPDC059234 TaxID=3346781 RepID=UPI00366E729A
MEITTTTAGRGPGFGLLDRDVSEFVPAQVPGLIAMAPAEQAVWDRAAAHLHVRDNDVHTVYSFGIAAALVGLVDGARAEVVLPAILLHDTGWSRVPEDQVLEAIAPQPRHPELIRVHEIEGARIARAVLEDLGRDPAVVDEVVDIVDGHDSRIEAISPSDAVVKDADKLWRLTPHGLATVQRWFGLGPDQALRLVGARTHEHLHTEPARAMARALAAIASIDLSPQRRALEVQVAQ